MERLSPGRVQLLDRTFTQRLTYPELRARIAQLAEQWNARYTAPGSPEPILVPVLTGAYRFFVELLPQLRFAHQVSFVKLRSYAGTDRLEGPPAMELNLQGNLAGRPVLILEDIVDTGHTLSFLRGLVRANRPEHIEVATLLFKPAAFRGQRPPDWVGFELPPAFVVGFGLDYRQEGRYLQGIYQLAE